jgi:hypothetical protein
MHACLGSGGHVVAYIGVLVCGLFTYLLKKPSNYLIIIQIQSPAFLILSKANILFLSPGDILLKRGRFVFARMYC